LPPAPPHLSPAGRASAPPARPAQQPGRRGDQHPENYQVGGRHRLARPVRQRPTRCLPRVRRPRRGRAVPLARARRCSGRLTLGGRGAHV
jgi:hypothetical protein